MSGEGIASLVIDPSSRPYPKAPWTILGSPAVAGFAYFGNANFTPDLEAGEQYMCERDLDLVIAGELQFLECVAFGRRGLFAPLKEPASRVQQRKCGKIGSAAAAFFQRMARPEKCAFSDVRPFA